MTILNDTRKADLYKLAGELGRDAGNGDIARYELGKAVFLGAADSFITSDKDNEKNDDIRPIYLRYSENQAKKNTFRAVEGPKSIVQQVSKLRSPAIVGGSPLFLSSRIGNENTAKDFITLVDDRIKNLAKLLGKNVPAADKLTTVMVKQKKLAAPMTAEEIDAAIAPKPVNKNELKAINSIVTSLTKLAKDYPDSADEANEAIDILKPRIATLTELEKEASLAEVMASFTPEQIAAAQAKAQAKAEAEGMKLAAE